MTGVRSVVIVRTSRPVRDLMLATSRAGFGLNLWRLVIVSGAEVSCLALPSTPLSRPRIGNQWGEWCAEIQLAHCVRSVSVEIWNARAIKSWHPAIRQVRGHKKNWWQEESPLIKSNCGFICVPIMYIYPTPQSGLFLLIWHIRRRGREGSGYLPGILGSNRLA